MTSTLPPESHAPHPLSTSRDGRATDWVRDNGRVLGIVGGVFAVVLLGGVAWRSSERAKAQRAEQALYQAESSLTRGDPSQAERSLRDVATRYGNTSGGAQAQLMLTQTLYEQGRYQDGLNVLNRTKPPAQFVDAFRLLTAAGYEGIGKGGDAGKLYEELATSRGVVPRRRDELRSAAARAYQLGNDRASALRVWRQVVAGGTGSEVDEARVRVGELTAR